MSKITDVYILNNNFNKIGNNIRQLSWLGCEIKIYNLEFKTV